MWYLEKCLVNNYNASNIGFYKMGSKVNLYKFQIQLVFLKQPLSWKLSLFGILKTYADIKKNLVLKMISNRFWVSESTINSPHQPSANLNICSTYTYSKHLYIQHFYSPFSEVFKVFLLMSAKIFHRKLYWILILQETASMANYWSVSIIE